MSAFLVGDAVINQAVSALAHHRRYGSYTFHDVVAKEAGHDLRTPEGRAALAAAMFALNVQAIEERYGKGRAAEFRPLNFEYQAVIPPTLIQAYKHVGCWHYQCAEGDVPETPLYQAMQKVYDELAHAVVKGLPEYDRAEW